MTQWGISSITNYPRRPLQCRDAVAVSRPVSEHATSWAFKASTGHYAHKGCAWIAVGQSSTRVTGAKFKSMCETVLYESASGAGLKRSDFFRLLSGRHFDVGVFSLDEIVHFPPLQLQLGAVAAGGPIFQTAAQQTTWREWVVEADKVCFGALTCAAAKKVKDHSPATVIPIIFSAGGALPACDIDLLPEPEDRNWRQWMRVELGLYCPQDREANHARTH